MADQNPHELSAEKYALARDWLVNKGVMRACTVCGENSWQLAKHAIWPNIYGERGPLIGGTSYPQIMLICNNCAHTVYFNAVLMGLFSDDLRKAEKKSEDAERSGDTKDGIP